MNSLIPKARRPKFDLNLRICDLNNVPLVSGTSYVKWHLPSSTAAEHHGRTEKSGIKDHKVSWDYTRAIPIRLLIDKANKLQECLVHFEIIQDYSSGGRGEKTTLGIVTLNLAEYVEESEPVDAEEGVVRRYLLQESKINSTLKIGIAMKQVDGERNFIAPALKTAPVFGGIAGIIAGEQAEQDEMSSVPAVSKPRDHNDLQDMYRRTLAASWAAQEDELPADECIEDIFAGGDGWKRKYEPQPSRSRTGVIPRGDSASGDEQGQQSNIHDRKGSSSSSRSQSTVKDAKRRGDRKERSRDSDIEGATGIQNPKSPEAGSGNSERGRGREGTRRAREVNEFDVREDLIAWRLPGRANTP